MKKIKIHIRSIYATHMGINLRYINMQKNSKLIKTFASIMKGTLNKDLKMCLFNLHNNEICGCKLSKYCLTLDDENKMRLNII